MKFSVVIITHNNFSEKNGCIETVLLAILNQKQVDVEIILVDNNSSDFDKKMLNNLVKSEDRIKLINNPINNISSGRNFSFFRNYIFMSIFCYDEKF